MTISVALDYLATRPEVDPQRIGFIGHSYGGRMAIWAPAIDDRILASVSNCGCVNYKQSFTHDTGVQMEFCLPGVLQLGDVEDILKLVAPRALLLQATADDKWSRGAEAMFAYAESSFSKRKAGAWILARRPRLHTRNAEECLSLSRPASQESAVTR